MALEFSDKGGLALVSPAVAVLGPEKGDAYTITVEYAERNNRYTVTRKGCTATRIPPIGTIRSVTVEGKGAAKWEALIYDSAVPGLVIPLTVRRHKEVPR